MKIIGKLKEGKLRSRGNRPNVNVGNSTECFTCNLSGDKGGISSLKQVQNRKKEGEDKAGVEKKLPENKKELFEI